MALEARRAYSDLSKWIAASRPPRSVRERFALRAFMWSFVVGVIVLGLIGLGTPSRFGEPTAQAFSSGLPTWILLGTVALFVLVLALRWRDAVYVARRVREPFSRPLDGDPNFEGAVGAFEECPQSMRARFAVTFIYIPAIEGVLATFFVFSSVYFLIDAILQRFVVGWQQPVLGAANAVLGLILWRLAAARLLTWRLAASVNKTVQTGYLE